MKSDVIIVGAELDSFLACIRLNELGFTSRILSSGKGSLLYSLGNIKILNLGKTIEKSPFHFFNQLPATHPYKLIGEANVKKAIDWFFGLTCFSRLKFSQYRENVHTISPVGLTIPSAGLYYKQIDLENIKNQNISIVAFENHKDFHPALIEKSLKKIAKSTEVVIVRQPDQKKNSDSSALAISFDELNDFENYFFTIREKLSKDSSTVIFPAVLGLNHYIKVIRLAEKILNKKCFEAPTLFPSIPALRFNLDLEKEVIQKNSVYRNSTLKTSVIKGNKCISVIDSFEKKYMANAFIVANGGILMGGVKVQSNGDMQERIFNPKIQNNRHLAMDGTLKSLIALQTSGVKTNNSLNPLRENNSIIDNVYYTGRNLANWNPSTEFSSEGVSIASGWYTANQIAKRVGKI